MLGASCGVFFFCSGFFGWLGGLRKTQCKTGRVTRQGLRRFGATPIRLIICFIVVAPLGHTTSNSCRCAYGLYDLEEKDTATISRAPGHFWNRKSILASPDLSSSQLLADQSRLPGWNSATGSSMRLPPRRPGMAPRQKFSGPAKRFRGMKRNTQIRSCSRALVSNGVRMMLSSSPRASNVSRLISLARPKETPSQPAMRLRAF